MSWLPHLFGFGLVNVTLPLAELLRLETFPLAQMFTWTQG